MTLALNMILSHTPTRLILLTAVVLAASSSAAPGADVDAAGFLKQYCVDCHGSEKPKGDLSLVSLDHVTAANADTWERMLQQVALGEMPPKNKPQPSYEARQAMVEWMLRSLTAAGRSPTMPGGPLPGDGNLVDHEQLFSGAIKGPASSPPRFWRRSQPQYDSIMEDVRVIPRLRYEKAHQRSDPEWAAYSYSQPFTSLDPERFTNYSGEVHADEATLRALMDAGTQIAERLTSEKVAYSQWLQPPIANGIPSIKRGSDWEKFRLDPPAMAAEFKPFVEKDAGPGEKEQRAAIARVFRIMLDRAPSDDEQQRYGAFLSRSIEKNGALAALRGLITAVFVSPEFVFRMEVGMGPRDEHGRRMLSSNELVYAIAFALTDAGPDEALWQAARGGKLATKADVEREARRILDDDSIEKARILRFFQEFFGYHRAGDVFKDQGGWSFEVQYLIRDADLFVEHILKKDRDVIAQLLTADRYFVALPVIEDEALFQAIIAATIQSTKESIEKTKARGKEITPNPKGEYNRAWAYMQGFQLIPRTVHNDRGKFEQSYIRIYGFDGNTFNWTRDQPIQVPGRRAGILTHPAWLVAHSSNFDNDVVGRGHWVREHLLAGRIPDVPLDVEAQVPDEPDQTLRHRMRVTQADRCIRCHRRMDPLGFPFEIYDHYGQYREKEMVGTRKNQPHDIDASGQILETGDPSLDGVKVNDAIDLVHKLAGSSLVRQSVIRHAFRYWMGRNEVATDSPTLIAADQAYVRSGGSFKEVIVSLLTSDSFLYRK